LTDGVMTMILYWYSTAGGEMAKKVEEEILLLTGVVGIRTNSVSLPRPTIEYND
jgi:hypothetical protein